MLSSFGQVVSDCREVLISLNTISVFFVKQSANMVAHLLATMSYSHPGWVFDKGLSLSKFKM